VAVAEQGPSGTHRIVEAAASLAWPFLSNQEGCSTNSLCPFDSIIVCIERVENNPQYQRACSPLRLDKLTKNFVIEEDAANAGRFVMNVRAGSTYKVSYVSATTGGMPN
tara:strand:- start:832 stop:1158 length:327 start_codon:yes stop_codon:yes gene_type:complete